MEIEVKQFSSDKILRHLDRVNEWMEGGNPVPITVELDLTDVCNHRCPECAGHYFRNRKSNSLSLGLITDIINQLVGIGVRGLIFTGGGEPLCSCYAMKAVKLAYDLGIDIGFITNGSLINKETADVLVKCCIWIRVSLDAASAETFKETHGMNGQEFTNILDNIKLLVEAKRDNLVTIGVGYLTSETTRDEMLTATILCRNLKVDYIQFRPLQVRNGNNFEYCQKGVREQIYKLFSYSTDDFAVLYSKHKYETGEKGNGRCYGKCYGQQFVTVIDANGCMYICCHMRGNEKYFIGDLRKDNFITIWNSSRRQEVVKRIDFKDCIPLCRDNTFNQILWNIKQSRKHINFL